MTVSGIYHIMEFTTLVNLVKLGRCLIEFQGTSLNKELLQGPDLTSKLVGVLTRFRTEEVAFISDIEAMFHKAHVPRKRKELS